MGLVENFSVFSRSGSASGSSFDLELIENFWGYIVAPGRGMRVRADLGEGIATIGSLLFGTVAFAQWLMPGVNSHPDLIPFKIGITAVFFVIAGLLYSMAKRGLSSETQIDLHEREIRVVRRNRSEESITLTSCRFDDVDRLEIKRTPGAFMLSSLYVFTRYDDPPIQIATSSEIVLEPILDRIMNDISPQPERRKPSAKRFFAMPRKMRKAGSKSVFGTGTN